MDLHWRVLGLLFLVVVVMLPGCAPQEAPTTPESDLQVLSEEVNMDNRVVLVDVDIPFGKMVMLIVKWSLASIPAMIILTLVFVAITALLGACGTLPFLANWW